MVYCGGQAYAWYAVPSELKAERLLRLLSVIYFFEAFLVPSELKAERLLRHPLGDVFAFKANKVPSELKAERLLRQGLGARSASNSLAFQVNLKPKGY